MKKMKFFNDAQQEEAWLNSWLQKGWRLRHVNFFGIYSFDKTTDSNQAIRIDFQEFTSKAAFEEYKLFHEEFGWQHVAGTRHSTLQYWLSPSATDVLFSDAQSTQFYYSRLTKYYGTWAFFFFMLTMITFDNVQQFASIRAAYYTPGIWEMESTDFVTALLIETPFALVRFGSPWFMLLCTLLFLMTYMKYKKKLKNAL